MTYWIAQPPLVEGQVGTGPVDLSLATQIIAAPEGFDLPGGADVIFDRAYRWFMDAAGKSTSDADRRANYLGAFRAANNLAVYCMTKKVNDDGSAQRAYDYLLEAERLVIARLPGLDVPHGGVLFNLGSLMQMIGRKGESDEYRSRARALGVSQ